MTTTPYDFASLARVNPTSLLCQASIRQICADFKVAEVLPFSPSGEGTHAYVFIEKTDANTDWVAKQLADFCGVKEVAIGYAGLKDRRAITRQWFSINLEGTVEPDWQHFEVEGVQILELSKHQKKLKRGVLSANQFSLRLSNISGAQSVWEKQLKLIVEHGVPNYFTEQRFGHQHNNLTEVDRWFSGGRRPKSRHKKSLYLSAARSWLFNLVLAERIKQENWNDFLAGDVMLLANTKASYFQTDKVDIGAIKQRLREFDIHPTGPLWGNGELISQAECQVLENHVLTDWQNWLQGLQRQGLKQERRALRVVPDGFQWQWENEHLCVDFSLPAGSYATAVLRELANITDLAVRNFSPVTASEQ